MRNLNLNENQQHQLTLFFIGICLFTSFLVNLNIQFLNLLDINLGLPIQAITIVIGLIIFRKQLPVTYRQHKYSIY